MPRVVNPRDTPILGAGGRWTNQGVGSSGSYLVSWQTAYQVAVERDHGRLTTHLEVMDFSVEHGYRYLRILAEEPSVPIQTVSPRGSPHCYKSRRVPCAKTVPESDVFMPLGLALSEKQVPRFVGNVSS
jgi:hypothetical protein